MSGYIGTAPVPQAVQRRENFTATAGQTSFPVAGYTVGFLDVYLNGVHLLDTVDYTATNSSDIVLTAGASAGDVVEVISFETFEVASQTFTGTTTVDALTATGAFTSLGIDDNATSTAITIDASENVGIGVVPESWGSGWDALQIGGNGTLFADAAAGASKGFYITQNAYHDGTNNKYISTDEASRYIQTGGTHKWQNAASGSADANITFSTRMTIDASGNLLVGKTDTATGTVGVQAKPNGGIYGTRDAGAPLVINRLTSDGTIVAIMKNTSTVGSIGTNGSRPYFYGGSGIKMGLNAVQPCNSNGSGSDNDQDLGSWSVRWDDVYATNGTIQTSDRNEKQQIAALTTAEITAAKAISEGFKTFKWNDSVAEKGAEARIHSGVIAQEVEQALTDAGLDAGDYAFFISNTWWETHTEVPAVEAVAEVLDAEGVVITEAVEAKEAYTRTDTYHTLAEAPEGATERTRKGIRYPQLLAFVGAATEQRLASIETRLTALEVTP